MSAPLRSFRVYFRDVEIGIMDVQALTHADARTKAWAEFRGIGDLPTRETETIIDRVECLDEGASQSRLYAVALNVPSTVTLCIEAQTEQEACEQALARFLANPSHYNRQELGNPCILSCAALSRSEDPS